MAKSALVIPAHQRFQYFNDWTPSMVSRDICETDPSTLQVLPYVILLNELGEIYMYTRGSAGDESRLHAKRSIGLGGHIDSLPGDRSMEDHIAMEAIREVQEECGYEPDFLAMKKALAAHNRIYLTDTDVDSVHLGIAILLHVKKDDITKPEEGTIVNPQWVSVEELKHYAYMERLIKPQCLLWGLENWSKQVVSMLTVQNYLGQFNVKQNAEIDRYCFYLDVVQCMNKVGIKAKLSAVRGLAVKVPLWETEEGSGEGYVKWSIENEERYKKVEQYLEGFVFSDGTNTGEVLVTPDFERWEFRDISTLHPLTAPTAPIDESQQVLEPSAVEPSGSTELL